MPRCAPVGGDPNANLPSHGESLQALSLYVAVFIVPATLLVDAVLGGLDPRIRDQNRIVR